LELNYLANLIEIDEEKEERIAINALLLCKIILENEQLVYGES
jgi:hypothetical protein